MESEQIIFQQLPAARRSMRVAVVTETYPPEINGVAITIHRMIEGLRARNHEIQLIRPRQSRNDFAAAGPRFEEVLRKGMSIPRSENLKMGLPAKQALIRLWSLNRPDIVHIVTEGPLGFSALAAALKLRIPCSSDFHTNFHSYSRHYGIGWLRKPISGYLRRFHNKSQATIVPTASMRDSLDGHGYLNLRVVPRGVDTGLFTPRRRSNVLRNQWGVTPEQPVALYVGRLAPEKNLPVVIKAYDAMRNAVYTPENGAQYSAGGFSQGLKQTAQLVKARVGLEAVSLDLEGWDSHFAQSTVIEPLMRQLAQGLAAFRAEFDALASQYFHDNFVRQDFLMSRAVKL